MVTGMMQGLSDNLIKVFEASRSKAAEILGSQLSSMFVNLRAQDPEKAKQFMTALNSIDWKKIYKWRKWSFRQMGFYKRGNK